MEKLENPSVEEIILQCIELDSSNKPHSALDKMYILFDRLSQQDKGKCDLMFSLITPQKLGVQLSVGLLTISISNHYKFPSREKFYNDTESWLQDTDPKIVAELLRNLK